MKTIITFLLISTTTIFSTNLNAQTGYWKLKEIIHGNHFGSQNKPTKLELNANEGYVEFSMPQKNNCTDKYRFSYKFLQDMNLLEVPENSASLPTYAYEFEFKELKAPCYDLNNYNYSNPYAQMTHWNTSSGFLGELKKQNKWKYKYHQQFIDEGSVAHYAHQTSVYKVAERGTGKYKITGPPKKDVDYYLKNYAGIVTDFRILIKGQSTLPGRADDFYYDILFIYELAKEGQSTNQDPCAIKKPDCSCCPGTIPVWNFQTNKGDCICPEGKTWDRMKNSCVD